ncbi:hypothetical protein VA249_14000 [Vibrio alfacsensis]|nr:hypothetical protein VA249_14000 [Vibrio alfacsensis]
MVTLSAGGCKSVDFQFNHTFVKLESEKGGMVFVGTLLISRTKQKKRHTKYDESGIYPSLN